MLSVFINVIKALRIPFKKANIFKFISIGLITLFLCSTAYYYFESPVKPDLSMGDAIWWGIVTSTTVGYGDYYPYTFGGRAIATLLMLIGISAFGFITAAIASVFVENRLKEGMGLMNIRFKGHIVVIGWNSKSEIIVQELARENSKIKIVVIDQIDRLTLNYENVFFVHGDPSQDKSLKKANVQFAKTVLVVSDESIADEGMADAKSVLICLAIDKLNTDIHLIAEVRNEQNAPHFNRANVDDIIITNQMSSRMMVRSALYKNAGHALRELLTNAYGNEIYELRVHPEDIGLMFKDLVCEYIEKYNAVILGLTNGELMLNPDKNRKVQEGDIIIYIAKERIE